MTDKIVADRYAKALVDTTTDLSQIDRLYRETAHVAQMIEKDESLRKFLLSPLVVPSVKKEIVKKAFEGSISKELMNLIFLIIDKHREAIITDVFTRFDQLAQELRGVETGTVISAVPINEDDFNLLEEKVQKFSRRRITLKREVDPSIIGGVVLWLGDHVIDGSVKNRLETIRRNLLELKPQLSE